MTRITVGLRDLKRSLEENENKFWSVPSELKVKYELMAFQ
jgi:hypothetical protein